METRKSAGRATAYLLTQFSELYTRFVEFRANAEPNALSLWAVHTWVMEAAHATPYILITSPEKRSGKTRVLEVSELIVASPLRTDSISPAALFRVIQQERPTLLVDEIDATFGAQEREALRGLINGGHTRGGQAVRVSGEGSRMQVQRFETFGPKAFAGIDNRRFPETIRDRAIVIRLRRRTGGGPRFRVRHVAAEVKPLRDAAESWAAGAVELLRDAEPQLPQALDDRALDIWEPLIAIAELAGGDWPERARLAAVELAGERSEDESAGVRCLRDIRAFFDRVGDSSVASGDLVAELNQLDESPWGSMRDGQGLDERALARQLRPYGIRPRAVRLPTGHNRKGYPRSVFEDAWERYLHAPSTTLASQRHSGINKRKSNRQSAEEVSDAPVRNFALESECDAVTEARRTNTPFRDPDAEIDRLRSKWDDFEETFGP